MRRQYKALPSLHPNNHGRQTSFGTKTVALCIDGGRPRGGGGQNQRFGPRTIDFVRSGDDWPPWVGRRALAARQARGATEKRAAVRRQYKALPFLYPSWFDGRDCLGTKTAALCIDGAPLRDFRLQGLMLSSWHGWFRYREYFGHRSRPRGAAGAGRAQKGSGNSVRRGTSMTPSAGKSCVGLFGRSGLVWLLGAASWGRGSGLTAVIVWVQKR